MILSLIDVKQQPFCIKNILNAQQIIQVKAAVFSSFKCNCIRLSVLSMRAHTKSLRNCSRAAFNVDRIEAKNKFFGQFELNQSRSNDYDFPQLTFQCQGQCEFYCNFSDKLHQNYRWRDCNKL